MHIYKGFLSLFGWVTTTEKAHLSANSTAFPAGERPNFDPIRCEFLEKGEGAVDYFAVEDVVPEEKGGRRLEIDHHVERIQGEGITQRVPSCKES